MMKRLFAMMLAAVVGGCTGYGYPVRDGGDGVYYAESPPVYTYVDSYFGYPYFGPWAWSWYYPVWYSPIPGPHYSWYCPGAFWSDPVYYRFAGGPVRYSMPARRKPTGRLPVDEPAQASPIMPIDLTSAVVGSRRPAAYGKPMSYGSSAMKGKVNAASAGKAGPRGYGRPYGAPTRSSRPALAAPPRPSSRSSYPSRAMPRHVSENKD